jgi:hypothetical protein
MIISSQLLLIHAAGQRKSLTSSLHAHAANDKLISLAVELFDAFHLNTSTSGSTQQVALHA